MQWFFIHFLVHLAVDAYFVTLFKEMRKVGTRDPADHGMVIAAEPLQIKLIWYQGVATVKHSLVNAGPVHLATYPR